MKSWSLYGLGLLAALSGCLGCGELPDLAPSSFACVDDRSLEDGAFPCGSSHWCVDGRCEPRLGCQEPDSAQLGCLPNRRRCEPVVTDDLAAVRCEGGVHTSTSARPSDPESCECPDGLHCVAFLEAGRSEAPFQPDLRLLPEGGPAPETEVPEYRMCARACSSEADCSAGHTCRPAVAEGPSEALEDGLGRRTVAVCYPDVIVSTSTTTRIEPPMPDACRQISDCPGDNRVCRYRPEPVEDHPVEPIGSSWGPPRALIARCSDGTGVETPSCTSGQDCGTGLCVNRRCRLPCDPDAPSTGCALGRLCLSETALFNTPAGPVADRVHLCDQ